MIKFICAIIWIILLGLSFFIGFFKHGEKRPNYNFIEILIGIVIQLILLILSGVFEIFGTISFE